MDLNWVKLNGFKRFEQATLNTSGKLIALVGPNEAGKSSLLEALTFLNNNRKFDQNIHLTRYKNFNNKDIILEAGFLLNEEDLEAISSSYSSRLVRWLIIQKPYSGETNYFLKCESELEPIIEEAKNIIKKRVPKFLFFSEQERNLESHFNFATSGKQKCSKALENLLKVADLDINRLKEINTNHPQLSTTIKRANKKIRELYKGKWSQSKLRPTLNVNDSVLRVFIENGENEDFDLNLRSDGLRQFVALINFIEIEHAKQPVLLVDEADLHLHYDAQADLINIFTKQKFASKIIYTTHSVGCLPEDLGTGVKLIAPLENVEERSTIKKHFWSADQRPGVLPLLFGMGASQLAFMAIRQSVFVEGATDMLLLPTLFRQATQREHLGFQIVQGIAMTSKANFGLLENHAPKVAFLVDNDQDGNQYKQQLQKSKIAEDRIFQLPQWGKAIVLEDYIRKELYLEAVNEHIKTWNDENVEDNLMSLDDIPEKNRPEAVKTWCNDRNLKPVDKVTIAYYLLDLATDERQEKLIEDSLQDKLVELYKKIIAAFKKK